MIFKITCLDHANQNRLSQSRFGHRRSEQTGSALAIAVFIIVVMAILATGISKSISSSSEQTVYEVFGTRALFAAESANERMLAQIFPLTGSGDCAPPQAAPILQATRFSTSGLQNCVVSTTCASLDPEDAGIQYYQVVSTAVCKARLLNDTTDFSCGNENICASRTIEVEAKAL